MKRTLLSTLIILASQSAFSYDCNDVKGIDQGNLAVLNVAKQQNNVQVLHALLSKGVSMIARQYGTGSDYYLWSVCESNSDLFRFLLNNTPKDNRSAQYALARALQHLIVYKPENFVSMQQLHEEGLSIETPISHMGVSVVDETPLLASVNHISPNVELIKYLLERNVDIYAVNRDGETAILKAIKYVDPYFSWRNRYKKYFEIIDLLLDHVGDKATDYVNMSSEYSLPIIEASFSPRDNFNGGPKP